MLHATFALKLDLHGFIILRGREDSPRDRLFLNLEFEWLEEGGGIDQNGRLDAFGRQHILHGINRGKS
jgi:hypothetical protein